MHTPRRWPACREEGYETLLIYMDAIHTRICHATHTW